MPALVHAPLARFTFPTVGALAALAALLLVTHNATAQSASGTVTGRVLWGSCVRAIPLPMMPGSQVQPQAPAPADSSSQQMPGQPALQPSGLPAGAVLVAVQNTGVSARTDETGRFSLSGVPAGQYMTVAAGPVADALSATASRPNVFVNGGQTVDVGTLALGGPQSYGFPCRVQPYGTGAATPGDVVPPDVAPGEAPGTPTP